MQGARAICSLCPGLSIRQRCRCLQMPADAPRRPPWLPGARACHCLSGLILAPSVHIAQIPSSASSPKRGGLGTRPLCGHRTPSTTLQHLPSSGRGQGRCRGLALRPWLDEPRVGTVFIPFSLWEARKHLHLASSTAAANFTLRFRDTIRNNTTRLFRAVGYLGPALRPAWQV
jgi:hypothetical protein